MGIHLLLRLVLPSLQLCSIWNSSFACRSDQVLLLLKFFEFLMEKLSSPAPSEPVTAMDSSGIVLVAGATGGVGRRVVNILWNKGMPVRVLVLCSNLIDRFPCKLRSFRVKMEEWNIWFKVIGLCNWWDLCPRHEFFFTYWKSLAGQK